MSISAIIIITLAIGIIVGGILLLRKSAGKFNLTPEQLTEIKKRNDEINKEEQQSE